MTIEEMAQRMGRSPFGGAPRPEAMGCGATRIVPVGGDLASLLLHPSVTPLQRIYRRLPEEGIYTASQNHPFTFEMGAFVVPQTMALAVAEYQFDIFRYNGASPWDMVPLETRRFPLSVGYDLNFDQYHKGNIQVEILPAPALTQQEAFSPMPTGGTIAGVGSINPLDLYGQSSLAAPAVPTVYQTTYGAGPNAAALANTAVTTVGAGNALLPQNQESQQGPRRFPFTYYAKENQAVQLRIALFGFIPIPIAFFEARLSGYLMPMNTLETMLKSVAPCTTQPGSQ